MLILPFDTSVSVFSYFRFWEIWYTAIDLALLVRPFATCSILSLPLTLICRLLLIAVKGRVTGTSMMKQVPTRWNWPLAVLALGTMAGCQGLTSSNKAATTQTKTNPAVLTIAPSSISFGVLRVGNNQSKPATITNSGGSTLLVSQVTPTGSGFSVSGLSLPVTLPAGQNQGFTIIFTPTTLGTVNGNLAIANTGSTPMVNVALTGESTTAGVLSPSPLSLNFGSVQVGGNQTLPETLTNSGGSRVTVTQVTPTGTGYSVSGLSLHLVLGAGQNQAFSVNFAPTASGTSNGNLAIVSDASNAPVNVALAGSGLASGALTPTPSSLSFGNVQVGNQQQLSEIVTNTGAVSVSISQAAVSGSGFGMSSWAPQVLTPGQHYTFTVTFTPSSIGNYPGGVSIVSNASNPNLSVPLIGTGTPVPQRRLTVSPTTMAFGNVIVGTNAQMQGTLTTSDASVTVTSATLNGAAFALSGLPSYPIVIPAGQHVQYTGTFTPPAVGAAAGSVSFTSNASNSPTIESLTGTGQVNIAALPPTMFYVDINEMSSFPLQVPYSGFRGWDSPDGHWPGITETASGQTCDPYTAPNVAIHPAYDPLNSCYSWTTFNTMMSNIKVAGMNNIMYTLSRSPIWAVNLADDPQQQMGEGCNYYDAAKWAAGDPRDAPGQCLLPPDINADGSGSNQTWRDWVTALATEVNGPVWLQTHPHVEYWEPWNEFERDTLIDNPGSAQSSFEGTYAELLRIVEDTRCIIKGQGVVHNYPAKGDVSPCDQAGFVTTSIDPTSLITTPSGYAGATGTLDTYDKTLANFLYCDQNPQLDNGATSTCTWKGLNWGSNSVDIINWHGTKASDPEFKYSVAWPAAFSVIHRSDLESKPLMCGECGVHPNVTWTVDTYDEAAYIPRYMALQFSAGFTFNSWYEYDSSPGGFVSPSTQVLLHPVSDAWIQTYAWLNGAIPDNKPFCSANGTVWTCPFTATTGNKAQLVWDAQYGPGGTTPPTDCADASDPLICGSTSYQVPATYSEDWIDIMGTVHAHESIVTIGAVPILQKGKNGTK